MKFIKINIWELHNIARKIRDEFKKSKKWKRSVKFN